MINFHDEIQKAIGAHGMWKQRLRSAIATGTCEFDLATVCLDNRCAFGKWLYALDKSTQATPRCQSVKALHAEFHREAAHVLQLAVAGRKHEAEQALGFDSKFVRVSSKLTAEMMTWKRTALVDQGQPASVV